jgi:hypothetical protein
MEEIGHRVQYVAIPLGNLGMTEVDQRRQMESKKPVLEQAAVVAERDRETKMCAT